MTDDSNATHHDAGSRFEICPSCAAKVPVQSSRTYPGLISELETIAANHSTKSNVEEQLRVASEIACPNCGTRFQSEQIRLLGFLSPKQLRILLATIIWGIIAAILLTLATDLWK